jgi:hypothetical protein
MRENGKQVQHSAFPNVMRDTSSEELSNLLEESEQRRQALHDACVLQHEKIRLVILCSALLLLIACLVFFLFTNIFLPLFGAVVITYLLYKRVDAYFNKIE